MLERRLVTHRSLRSKLVSTFLRLTVKPLLTRDYEPVRLRPLLERTMGKRNPVKGVTIETQHSPVKGEWHCPANAHEGSCLLYLHGGGYITGSAKVYRSVTTRLAKLSGARVFSLDYRLTPEHPFPAAIDDALAAYEWLLEQNVDPTGLMVAGDSAGGGLALALVHRLKQKKLPLPAEVATFSPWTDLLTTGNSLRENRRRCAMFNDRAVIRAAQFYLQGEDGSAPLASPLYGHFADFPPLRIYVSDSEVLLDDGLRVAEKADRAGVPVNLNVWSGQPHAWPAFYPLLPEADRCLEEVAAAIRELGRRKDTVAP